MSEYHPGNDMSHLLLHALTLPVEGLLHAELELLLWRQLGLRATPLY